MVEARDTHKRSLLKATGYKTVSIILLAFLSWMFTKSLLHMTAITVTYEVIAIVGYYVYERLWDRVRWGRK